MMLLHFSPYFDCLQEHDVFWPDHCQNRQRLIIVAICSLTKKTKISHES